jgi:xylose isomerase
MNAITASAAAFLARVGREGAVRDRLGLHRDRRYLSLDSGVCLTVSIPLGRAAGDDQSANDRPRERDMKTSLGIWAFGAMATRFNPGGYKPDLAGASTAAKVRTAVEGLGDLMDDYEFHYPQELSPDNLEEVQQALDGHGIYCIASGLHLDPRFAKGGFSSPDDATRAEALRLTKEAIDLAGELGAHMIIWPGIEGYNYPFQTPYADSWRRFVDGVGESAQHARDRGVTVFLEHKNSEPAMKIFMRNIGMTLHVIHKLRTEGIDNVKVNMDWQHLIMNGENLAEYAALLAAEGLLGHQHANSGWGTFDDDNMVGATAFMETIELAVELRRANYGANGERLGFDLYPYTEDAVGAVKRSVLQWNFIDGVAGKIDGAALREAQETKDAVRAYELVYAALGA